MIFKYTEAAEYFSTVLKFGNVDHYGSIELKNGAGYVPMIPNGIDSEWDENAVTAQPLSSETFGLRRNDALHTRQPEVTGRSVDTQEAIDNEERNGVVGNDIKIIEVVNAHLIVCEM